MYALLATGSESTLIHCDFTKRLTLTKNSKIVNISSIKNSGKLINEDEFTLYVIDDKNTSSFPINKTLVIKRERFNMPFHFQQNGEWAHLQGLKLANINPTDASNWCICSISLHTNRYQEKKGRSIISNKIFSNKK